MSNHTPQRDGNPDTAAVESGQLRANLSGLSIKTSYSDRDISDFDSARDLGPPGEYPFTRGVHKEMYRQKLWTIRQLGSLDSPAKANERIRQLIDMGATGISICLDLPTIMGKDSDDPLALGHCP
jgi:methylmalonyl-CoA mutase N-terminal domain/subunit